MKTMQIESNRETGNWAYVVRENGVRILATGDRDLAETTLDRVTADRQAKE
jgi:hypothetical protein